jgi:hypothetical protein
MITFARMTESYCPRCCETKPVTLFYRRMGKPHRTCMACSRLQAPVANEEALAKRREYMRRYRENNRDKVKAIHKRWRDANRDKIQSITKEWRASNVEYAREWERERRRRKFYDVIDALKDVPCADCGGRFPAVAMDFDHRDPSQKSFDVSTRSKSNLDEIRAEISKCDVVCANCHRVRTKLRAFIRIAAQKAEAGIP